MRVLFVLLAAVSACGCTTPLQAMSTSMDRVRQVMRRIDCQDGAPAKLLIDPHCLDGICGVSCAPTRWWP